MTAELNHWHRREHSWLWWLLSLLLRSAGIIPAAPRARIAQKNCTVWAWSLIWDTCQISSLNYKKIISQPFLFLNLYPKVLTQAIKKRWGKGPIFSPSAHEHDSHVTLHTWGFSHSGPWWAPINTPGLPSAVAPLQLPELNVQLPLPPSKNEGMQPPGQPSLEESRALQSWYPQSSSRVTGKAEAAAYAQHLDSCSVPAAFPGHRYQMWLLLPPCRLLAEAAADCAPL